MVDDASRTDLQIFPRRVEIDMYVKISLSILLAASLFLAPIPIGATMSLSLSTASKAGTASSLTIQELINAANPGDTIYVPNGTYRENLVINKSITLLGENSAGTIIDGSGRGQAVQVAANDTGLAGFTVRNGGTDGIRLINCYNSNISSNTVKENSRGLYIENSHCALIYGNNITNNYLPVSLQDSDGNVIAGNVLQDNYGQAISIYKGHNNTIRDNSITRNPVYGIYLEESENNTISENTVTYVCQGVHLARSNNNTLRENTIANTGPYGIILEHSNNSFVGRNTLTSNEFTIQLSNSQNNIVEENNITENKWGILLVSSNSNTLRGNYMAGNWLGNFGVVGARLCDFINTVDVSNTVDKRPVYYWVNQHEGEIPADAGYVALVNCTEILVRDLNVTSNYNGLLLAFSNDTILRNLQISRSFYGLWMFHADNNTIIGCALKSNVHGIYLRESNQNRIYYSNFIGERIHDIGESQNTWDNGYPSGGNYWSDHAVTDQFSGPYQNMTGSDAISDFSHEMNSGNVDRFPLAAPVSLFEAGRWNDKTYYFSIISNSTVSNFNFDPTQNASVQFVVNGPSGTRGFCRVEIPNNVLWAESEEWGVSFGSERLNFTLLPYEDMTYLLFTFVHDLKVIEVRGTGVIPEFPSPSLLSIPMLIVLSMVALKMLARRKLGHEK